FMIWIDVGERDLQYVPILTYRNIILEDNKTIEDCLYSLKVHPSYKQGMFIPEQIIDDCLRIVVSCCLLSQDKEEGLIVPDVLAADREKFERSGDMKYVDKAKRRGKIGWDVGKKLDVNPHWRRAHYAWYHTGAGRTVPKLIFRKGAVVHREIVKEIPTGRLGENC